MGGARNPCRVASFRALLIRAFAALLFIQSGVAAAHCLRGMSGGDGIAVEICTSEGMRMLRLNAAGDPEEAPGEQAGVCAVCHGLPSITLPPPPLTVAPAWEGVPLAWRMAGEALLPPPARAPPYVPTGPPVTA